MGDGASARADGQTTRLRGFFHLGRWRPPPWPLFGMECPPARPLITYKGLSPLMNPLWGLRPLAPCLQSRPRLSKASLAKGRGIAGVASGGGILSPTPPRRRASPQRGRSAGMNPPFAGVAGSSPFWQATAQAKSFIAAIPQSQRGQGGLSIPRPRSRPTAPRLALYPISGVAVFPNAVRKNEKSCLSIDIPQVCECEFFFQATQHP